MKYILIGRGIQFAIGLLTYRILTSFLNPEEFGMYGLIITIAGFYSLFMINPVGVFINRNINEWYKKGLIREYLKNYSKYILFIGIITIPITFFIIKILSLNNVIIIPIIICIYIISNTFNQTVIPSLNLLGKDKYYSIFTIGTAILGLVISSVLMFFNENAILWIIGIIFSQIIFGYFGLKSLTNHKAISHININYKYWLDVFKYAWPIMITSGLIWIQLQAYKFVVVDYYGIKEFGYLIASYGVASALISAGEQILQNIFQPKCYKQINSKECWSNYANNMIICIFLYANIVFILIEYISYVFLSEEYRNNINIIKFAIICEIFRVINGVFGFKETLDQTTKKLIYPNIFNGILIIPIIIAILNSYTLPIAFLPLILLIGQLLNLIIFIINNKSNTLNNEIDKKNIFKLLILLFISLGLNEYLCNQINIDKIYLLVYKLLICVAFVYICIRYIILKIKDNLI